MIEIEEECIGDIKQPELIPDGEVLTVEVVSVPEVRAKKFGDNVFKEATNLNFNFIVADPNAGVFNGRRHFFNVSIPSKGAKAVCAAKEELGKQATDIALLNKTQEYMKKSTMNIPMSRGMEYINALMDDFYTAFGLKKGTFDEQKLSGATCLAHFGHDSWQGTPRNKIKKLMPLSKKVEKTAEAPM